MILAKRQMYRLIESREPRNKPIKNVVNSSSTIAKNTQQRKDSLLDK